MTRAMTSNSHGSAGTRETASRETLRPFVSERAMPSAYAVDRARRRAGEDVPRGPNGNRLCRWGQRECRTKRRTFCGSSACVEQWTIRTRPGYARRLVWKRDRGVCRACRLDTNVVSAALQRRHHGDAEAIERQRFLRCWAAAAGLLGGRLQRAYDNRSSTVVLIGFSSKALWQADHILPVAEGGGACGLENLQTLCTVCHTRKTSEQRARQLAARKLLKT